MFSTSQKRHKNLQETVCVYGSLDPWSIFRFSATNKESCPLVHDNERRIYKNVCTKVLMYLHFCIIFISFYIVHSDQLFYHSKCAVDWCLHGIECQMFGIILSNSNCKNGKDHPMICLCDNRREVEPYLSIHSQPGARWGVSFQQHHALAALPPGRPGTLCKGSLLNVESGLDGQGIFRFPPGFNPLNVESLVSRLIAKVAKILRLLYLGY
jgi:hypothetical protein